MDFSNGITKLSSITASEHSGLVFLLVCLAQFEVGRNILEEGLVTSTHKTDLRKVLHAPMLHLCMGCGVGVISYDQISLVINK